MEMILALRDEVLENLGSEGAIRDWLKGFGSTYKPSTYYSLLYLAQPRAY